MCELAKKKDGSRVTDHDGRGGGRGGRGDTLKRELRAGGVDPLGRLTGAVPTQTVEVKRMKAAEYNPRRDLKPRDPEYQAIVASFTKFGNLGGMVWNKRTGNLVAGHQRFKVLRDHFKVVAVETAVVDLDLLEEKTLNIRLNRHEGGWDDAKLAELVKELNAEGAGAVAGLTGLSAEEMKAIGEEGERLVEMLVPAEKGDGETGEGIEGGGGGGKEPSAFHLLVRCANERKQKRLFARLSEEGFECELRTS